MDNYQVDNYLGTNHQLLFDRLNNNENMDVFSLLMAKYILANIYYHLLFHMNQKYNSNKYQYYFQNHHCFLIRWIFSYVYEEKKIIQIFKSNMNNLKFTHDGLMDRKYVEEHNGLVLYGEAPICD